MPDAITHETRSKVARRVARNLARAHAWVDLNDCEQEAYLALLAAERKSNYDPSRGEHWLYVVARRELSGWIFRQRSLISATTYVLRDAKLATSKSVAREFAKLSVTHLDQREQPSYARLDASITALEAEAWSEAVKRRIMQLLDVEIIELFIGARKPVEFARERGVSVKVIRRQLREARDRVRSDAALRDLWQVV